MATTRTFSIDPSHSEITFRVKHLGISWVRGRFTEFEGTVEADPENLGSLHAEARIEAASIDTGTTDRDNHLRSGDFFDAENHPHLVFKSSGVKEQSDGGLVLQGELTIRDITRPVNLDVEFLGLAKDPWGGNRVAFSATGKLNRKDFGLKWNQALETGGFLVGDDVRLALELQAVEVPVEEEELA